MKNFRWVVGYVRNYWKYVFLNVTLNLFSVIFSLVSLTMIIPFLGLLFGTQELVEVKPVLTFSINSAIEYFYFLLSEIIIREGKEPALVFICLLVVVLFFLKNLFQYLAMFFMAPIRNGVIKDIRNTIYDKILMLPLGYFTDERKGDIIARTTHDVQEVEWAVLSSIEAFFKEPLAVVIFLGTLFMINVQFTLLVLVLLPVTGLLVGRIGKTLKKASDEGQKKMGSILSMVEETLSGLRVIKAFTAEVFSSVRFADINDRYSKLMVTMYRRRDLASPLSEFLGAVILVVLMLLGGRMVLTENVMEPSVFIGFIAVFSQLIRPAKAFTSAYYNAQKGMASAERIRYILESDERISEAPDAAAKDSFDQSVTFENVSFSYNTIPVLKNISFEIKKGQTIALVGHSGAGKSTLVDVLSRFYDVSDGDIKIDGISTSKIRIKDLRGLMGMVPQETILFNDTVFNNISFGIENAGKEDVVQAAKIANAHEFIEKLENGYHTNIGDRGIKLSGGQRQRLSIARAVLKNPPLLILDEATSSLDTESERLVQEALFKLMQNRTSLVIAHRLSTVQHADMIVVIQAGQIVETGTHDELISVQGAYRKLYDYQSFV